MSCTLKNFQNATNKIKPYPSPDYVKGDSPMGDEDKVFNFLNIDPIKTEFNDDENDEGGEDKNVNRFLDVEQK